MNPFELYLPSVFVVATPFQTLCAIAAINQLKISDYKIVAVLPKGEPRNNQVRCLLGHYHLSYETITNYSYLKFLSYKLLAFKKVSSQYHRIFIGDYRDFALHVIGGLYAVKDANIVYLDDGSASIRILQGSNSDTLHKRDKYYLNALSRWKNLILHKNLLTIYSDIGNRDYNICGLDLSYALKNNTNQDKEKQGIYIVGTNIKMYPLKSSEKDFIQKLDNFVSNLREANPTETIVYIPHGRDLGDYAKEICQKYCVEYRKTNMMIEIEMLGLKNSPKEVYGFTSTALYNLKKLYPHSEVVNILFKCNNHSYSDYMAISDYYLKNGIQLIVK